MGMFDYIRCEHPLPARNAEGLEFQTKDLACDLDQLVIRADGTLWRTKSAAAFSSDNPLGHLSDFFGEVRFYTFLNRAGNWLEFRARFVDGKLYGAIVLVEDTRGAMASDAGSATWAPESGPDGKRSPQKAQVDAILGAAVGVGGLDHETFPQDTPTK